jgi:hypothetical protein
MMQPSETPARRQGFPLNQAEAVSIHGCGLSRRRKSHAATRIAFPTPFAGDSAVGSSRHIPAVRRFKRDVRGVILLLLISFVAGCKNTPEAHLANTLLNRAAMTRDSVVFDIYFVRYPFGDERVNTTLWQHVDEQKLDTESRRWFCENGLRAGVVAGHVSPELADLLELNGKPSPCDQAKEGVTVDLLEEPSVIRRHMQLPVGKPGEIIASSTYDELPLLLSEGGRLCGETYRKATAFFSVQAIMEEDGRVRLQLTPKIRHGAREQQWIGQHGMLRPVMEQKCRVFDDPNLETTLAPGQMLILSSIPSRPGSLGHFFFTKGDQGKTEQKLMVIRLAQTQHDELFDNSARIATDTK